MKTLRQADALVIVFLALTSFVYFAVAGITASAVLLLLGNALISLLIVAAGRAYARRHSPLLDIARIFYPVVMILV
ncbi:MAG TPA: hypothetical protein VLA34_01225, partial [Candidatus Krumholzibacterium sp.]|nr:hypothetical protein [Candidatus Krumholzibacterium sp.]